MLPVVGGGAGGVPPVMIGRSGMNDTSPAKPTVKAEAPAMRGVAAPGPGGERLAAAGLVGPENVDSSCQSRSPRLASNGPAGRTRAPEQVWDETLRRYAPAEATGVGRALASSATRSGGHRGCASAPLQRPFRTRTVPYPPWAQAFARAAGGDPRRRRQPNPARAGRRVRGQPRDDPHRAARAGIGVGSVTKGRLPCPVASPSVSPRGCYGLGTLGAWKFTPASRTRPT